MDFPPTIADFEQRLGVESGELVGPDLGRATAAIDDATTLVVAELGTAEYGLWAAPRTAVLSLIVLKSARREYDNPRGYSYTVAGPVSASTSSTSGVYLTPAEVAHLQRVAAGPTSAVNGFVGSVVTPSAYTL